MLTTKRKYIQAVCILPLPHLILASSQLVTWFIKMTHICWSHYVLCAWDVGMSFTLSSIVSTCPRTERSQVCRLQKGAPLSKLPFAVLGFWGYRGQHSPFCTEKCEWVELRASFFLQNMSSPHFRGRVQPGEKYSFSPQWLHTTASGLQSQGISLLQ